MSPAQAPEAPRRAARGAAARPFVVPEGVTHLQDIAYREGGSQAWKLDLSMPKDCGERPRPAIVFIHGGGWSSGDKRGGTSADFFLNGPVQFAQKGYVCISINYRLSGEAPFPAAVEDVKCAVRWLRAHARDYNVDPDRVGAFGNSAGAHLVAMLGLVKKEAGLEGDGPYQEYSSLVQAVVSGATPTDFTTFPAEIASNSARMGFLKGPEATFAERAKRASPITYVRADAPPFLIYHGGKDAVVPVAQAESFVAALKKAGARDVTYRRFEDQGHGAVFQKMAETGPEIEAFFARTLRGQPAKSGAGQP